MGKAPGGLVIGLDDWENVVNMRKKRGRKKKQVPLCPHHCLGVSKGPPSLQTTFIIPHLNLSHCQNNK